MHGKSTPAGWARRDHLPRNVQPKQHDTYAMRRKERGAIECDRCGVVYHGGRWYWGAPPLSDVKDGLCPACQRIEDRCPAGTIWLSDVPPELHDELVGLVRNLHEREHSEHPLERVVAIEEDGRTMRITTTGIHMARCIANALQRRFHGGVSVRYGDEENRVDVAWAS